MPAEGTRTNPAKLWSQRYSWLSTRAINALAHVGIETVEGLREYGPERLRKLPNIGNKTVNELKWLAEHNGKPPPGYLHLKKARTR